MELSGDNRENHSRENSERLSTSAAHFNVVIVLRPYACWVEDRYGREKLNELIVASGLQLEDFDGETHWASTQYVEAFLSLVYDLTGQDDRAFIDIAGYKLAKSWGAMRFLVRAASPRFFFEKVVKNFHIVSTVSQQHLAEIKDHSCTIKYTTSVEEGRLLCLSRQGAGAALPAIWGLPKAELKEGRCVARGDDCCEYHLRWYRHQRKLWPLLGLLMGVLFFLVGYGLNPEAVPLLSMTALVFLLLGCLVELWKTNGVNLSIGDAMTAETRDLLHADAEVRKEIMLLSERQWEWTNVVTRRGVEGMADRQRLVEHLEALQAPLERNIRGLGHDIRTPLAVLRTHNAVMKMSMDNEEIDRAELNEILGLQDIALDKITDLVAEMMKVAKMRRPLKTVSPQEIDVGLLAKELRSRINALAYGHPIDTNVHLQEPFPQHIETDKLMLDRIIDNLLINATKYTQQGQIDVSLGGWNDKFIFEVRDTGRGIAEDDFPKIFQPSGSDPSLRQPGSYGLGLSVVTLLLAQLGGELMVESRLGTGSMFRCVLPVVCNPSSDDVGDISSLNSAALYQRVVSILPPSSVFS